MSTVNTRRFLLASLLFAGTLGLFSHTNGNDFINLDDPDYVIRNPRVYTGLTSDNMEWAFQTHATGNWHPLTWLSLQLDAQLSSGRTFRPRPGLFHFHNALLHAASAAVLFLALAGMTGSVWRSVFAAGLFALHPLRVESVAWVAERKDVLSALLGMLALWAYAGYARRPTPARYGAVAAALALGLLAKPTLVTLPCLLLLLDFWPLQRVAASTGEPSAGTTSGLRRLARLVMEKLPLLALSAGSCFMTMRAQQAAHAVRSWDELGMSLRVQNALVAYATYLQKWLWPVYLGAFYPHRVEPFPTQTVLTAAGLLAAITLVAILLVRRRPYLLVGWLWYLIALLPMIGLVQVGGQALADRYTYLPSIGLGLMAAWGIGDLAVALRFRPLAALVGVAAMAACAVQTWIQIGYWHDSVRLWQHTLRVAGPDPLTHTQLGTALYEQKRLDEAADQYRAALAMRQDYWFAVYDLGLVLTEQGKYAQAIPHLREIIQMKPDHAHAHVLLGKCLLRTGHTAEGIREMEQALAINPRSQEAASALASRAWELATNPDPAVRNGREAVRLGEKAVEAAGYRDPDILDALAAAYAETARFDEAEEAAQRALLLTRGGEESRQRGQRLQRYRAHEPYRQTSSAPGK